MFETSRFLLLIFCLINFINAAPAPAIVTVWQTVTSNIITPTGSPATQTAALAAQQQAAPATAVAASTSTGSFWNNLINSLGSSSSSSSNAPSTSSATNSLSSWLKGLLNSNSASATPASSSSTSSGGTSFWDQLEDYFAGNSQTQVAATTPVTPASTAAALPLANTNTPIFSQALTSIATTSSLAQTLPTSSSTSPSTSSYIKPSTSSSTSSSSDDLYAAIDQSQDVDASFASDMIDLHKKYRAIHQAGPLKWDVDLYNYAKNNADNYDCSGVLTHTHGPYGENLAAGFEGAEDTFMAWYNEPFDYNNPEKYYNHFTALIWKSTHTIGCAKKWCGDGPNQWRNYVRNMNNDINNQLKTESSIEQPAIEQPAESSSTDSSSDNNKKQPNGRQKRSTLACIRCRTRHIRCPGGDPCKKCQLAKTKCEYIEADKKIVVSMKYLSRLHDDIARLKKDNAMLRNNLKELEQENSANEPKHHFSPINQIHPPVTGSGVEVINPSLDKYGRLIQSRTGERFYVGSSSMTLFGLEIQNMVPPTNTSLLQQRASSESGSTNPSTPINSPNDIRSHEPRESKILEKEGNAYKITLTKTNTRPGLSMNFSLPSYSYAMLLVDTFINYNDGCFYFFNEGLIKQFLTNLYGGKTEENKKILRRNSPIDRSVNTNENTIKKDMDDETILETIWFCKILLIFASGEMYLGTESNTHARRQKMENMKRNKSKEKHTLPGAGFFYQASELFTGLFASGAIDNITKDGGIEVMLLYAFYLQVADCTIASYFYFGLALRAALILGWHVDAEKENLNRFELEHRRRIWWTVYMYERMLSSKAGLPLSFADDSVSTELPIDFKIDLTDFPKNEHDVRGYYIFPPADYINNCVTITQINAVILSSLYTKQPSYNILPIVSDCVQRLVAWKNTLPRYLSVDFSIEDPKVSRLLVNLMTEYFQGVNLAVRPLLFHFASKKFRELHFHQNDNKYIDLTKYSKNVLSLLNSSFQASINTIKSIWSLIPDNMVALFGWMDREYLFTSASTLILFNASFGVHEATKDHLDHALILFTKMKKLGNYPAALRRAQLLKLIKVLDFNGVMNELLKKHDDEYVEPDVTQQPEENLPIALPNTELYTNADLTGIEGLTYLDEEQKLWNEISNEAGWLNFHTDPTTTNELDKNFYFNMDTPNGYSDIINNDLGL
ncbi:PUT3 [Candida jiufengensis]|uniref:PUT3 n=1 Tax=Candida jiufengensis TaxID=497108 RepID=UPI0022241AC9|nr:PUT3 [Candida jiufengensis]KAI5951383.1 PUT3 [Candida jiufengensis]